MNSGSKKQKILLRISKRLVTADKQNLELFKSIGDEFIEYLKDLKNSAKYGIWFFKFRLDFLKFIFFLLFIYSAEANVTISSMVDEILRLI